MSVPARRGSVELDDLAGEIRREHGAAQDAFQSAVEHAIRCGELLIEVKAALPHGSWGDWISENFPASARTARGYMRLAEHREELERQPVADLTIKGALKQLAQPSRSSPEEADDELAVLAREVAEYDEAAKRHRENYEALVAEVEASAAKPTMEHFLRLEDLIDESDQRVAQGQALKIRARRHWRRAGMDLRQHLDGGAKP